MKAIAVIALSALLTACANMTQGQKQTAAIIGGIAAAAVLVSSSQSDDDDDPARRCTTVIGPNGNDTSCR